MRVSSAEGRSALCQAGETGGVLMCWPTTATAVARHHLVEHGAQRIEIGLWSYGTGHSLLRRHVGDCSDNHAGFGEAGEIDTDRQPEITYLGGTVRAQPDVARFQVAVNDSLRVREYEPVCNSFSNADRLIERQAMIGGLPDQIFHIAAREQRQDHERLPLIFAEVVNSDDVGVIAEASHGLGFAPDARAGVFIQLFDFDPGKGDVAVEHGIVNVVDSLLAPLTEQLPDLVAACSEGNRLRGRLG
jgi:hypothetical protein